MQTLQPQSYFQANTFLITLQFGDKLLLLNHY